MGKKVCYSFKKTYELYIKKFLNEIKMKFFKFCYDNAIS